jgi:hypothetical protein
MHEILNFSGFYNLVKNQKITFKTSYQLAMLNNEIEKHVQFYQEQFQFLLNQYGQKDLDGNFIKTEDGQGIKLIQDKSEECLSKMDELHSLEVNLPDYYFNLEEFEKIELTPTEVNAIIPFIKI